MGILNAFSIKPEVKYRNYNPGWLQDLNRLFMNSSSSGTSTTIVSEQQALTISAVFSATKLLSEIPASLDLQLRARAEEDSEYFKVVNEGAIAKVLRKPNSFQTSFTFQQSMLMKMLLRGNSWAFIKRSATGEKEFIPVYNADVLTTVSPDGTEIFYTVNGQPFAAWEMLHYRGLSLDGILGLSPITYASRTLNNAVDAEKYISKVYESGIISSGFFTTAERLTDKSYLRMKEDIKNKSGIDRAGEAQILDSGLKFERNTLTAADTEIIEQMGFSVEEICRIFRVPKHLLYLDAKGGSTRSFSTQAMEFLTYSLAPMLDNIQQELQLKLFTDKELESGDNKIIFDTKALLRVNPTERAEFYKQLFNIGSITPNEIRAEEGMPPVDGGDKTFVQLNLAPADQIEEIIKDKINKTIDSTNG